MELPHGGKTPITCSTTSVPMVSMMPAIIPASTAPMLRPMRRGCCVSLIMTSLRELGRKVGHCEKGGIDFFDDLAAGFGLVADALPLGVIAEGLPVGGGGFAARMGDDVDERFALEGIVGGRPVGDVFHTVLLEELASMFAKAAEEVVELALVGVIDAEFVDCCGVCCGAWLILRRGEPIYGREQRCGRERLKQGASFHGGILAELWRDGQDRGTTTWVRSRQPSSPLRVGWKAEGKKESKCVQGVAIGGERRYKKECRR